MLSRVLRVSTPAGAFVRMASSTSVPATAGVPGSKVSWTRPDGSDEVPGYAFGPEDAKAAVIVIQEWWGVTEDTKAQANYIGEQGYRVLVPDLYRGKLTLEAAEAQHHMEGLDWPGAVSDISGAAKFLKEQGASKVGVAGFCMGGALALASAVHSPDISASAPFYGTPPKELADVKTIKVPVLAQFGEKDDLAGFSDPDTVKQLAASLQEAGVEAEVLSHPGVGHGFMNSTPVGKELNSKLGRPEHSPDAINAAWEKLLAFFAKHLKE